jgi:hypothetical protein
MPCNCPVLLEEHPGESGWSSNWPTSSTALGRPMAAGHRHRWRQPMTFSMNIIPIECAASSLFTGYLLGEMCNFQSDVWCMAVPYIFQPFNLYAINTLPCVGCERGDSFLRNVEFSWFISSVLFSDGRIICICSQSFSSTSFSRLRLHYLGVATFS